MERSEDDTILEEELAVDEDDCEAPILNSKVFLDHVGEVVLTHNSDGLSWEPLTSFDNDGSSYLRTKLSAKLPSEIKISDVYAVELINYGSIHKVSHPNAGNILLGRETLDSKMFRFMVHSFRKSKTQPNVWVLAVHTFGHKDLPTCEMWVNRLSASLSLEVGRPKNLLVFVNPMSGKTNAGRTWETVAPIFARAKIKAKVVVTERAGHAFDVMTSTTNKEFNSYDGVIAVGGDGFFNEILNGYLSSRYKAPYPPAPTDFAHSVGSDDCSLVHNPDKRVVEASDPNDDQYPRLPSSQHYGSGSSNFLQDAEFPHHNEWFRFGIIPAGSTDAIAMCTTGARDPVTSALHIILGKRVCLDIAQIVSWRETATSKVEPRVRYAASFAGYGFYGDVITESEKYRWMGPKRYDYAGTKVFMRHRSYEAEVAYLDVESGKTHAVPDRGRRFGRLQTSRSRSKSERVICRTNCNICNKKSSHSMPYSCPKETRWLRSKGRFLSVGAAIISNRNERAPDGLVVDAHLSDGLLHLILIKDCPHALYLWHLTELARKGGNPLNFEFVEHHKTPAFTFTSSGNDSVWNIDGELFRAHQLSAQVFQGLISLFASGPEV